MPTANTRALRACIKTLQLLAYILFVFAIGYSFSGFRLVRQDERAVVWFLGKITPISRGPGIVPSLPPPFGHITIVKSTSVQTLELTDWCAEKKTPPPHTFHPIKNGYTLTRDINILQAHFKIRYRISNPVLWVKYARNPENVLRSLAYRNISATLAQLTVDEALSSLRTQWVNTCLANLRNDTNKLKMGVEIDALDIIELSPPSAVHKAFDTVTSAKMSVATIIDDARKQAYQIKNAADSEANSLLTKALSEKQKKVISARAWAERFEILDTQARIQPDVFARQYWKEKISTVFKKARLQNVLPNEGQNIRIFWNPDSPPDNE